MATQTEAKNATEAEHGESPSVHDYLDMALEAANEQGVSTSELMGIFFYYAHSIADSYRRQALKDMRAEPGTADQAEADTLRP